MGITMNYINIMSQKGLFSEGRIHVLDIGSSNLYSADQESVRNFFAKYGNRNSNEEIKAITTKLVAGSTYVVGKGGLNEAFVGEMLEKAGMAYTSFDIAYGYKTFLLDMNHSPLPSQFFQTFDLVLNFGTTEHILNQYNCFKIIHEATKVGGFIYHQLPLSGFVDHGYFVYTGRFFFDLAGFNGYEIVDCWFDGPSGANDILESVTAYKEYFPILRSILEGPERKTKAAELRAAPIPNTSINIIYKKMSAKPFVSALETSTSVGEMSTKISSSYQAERGVDAVIPQGVPSAEFAALKMEVMALRAELNSLKQYLSIFKVFKPVLRIFKRISK